MRCKPSKKSTKKLRTKYIKYTKKSNKTYPNNPVYLQINNEEVMSDQEFYKWIFNNVSDPFGNDYDLFLYGPKILV